MGPILGYSARVKAIRHAVAQRAKSGNQGEQRHVGEVRKRKFREPRFVEYCVSLGLSIVVKGSKLLK